MFDQWLHKSWDKLSLSLKTNKSTSLSEEETSNLTSSPRIESILIAAPNLMSSSQTANQTEETSKPAVTIEWQLSSGLLSDLAVASLPYKVKVSFDSMTVHNDHEGAFSGDGEYDIAAYVQDIKVGLTDASGPGDGLWDVSSGETVTFDPGTIHQSKV